ncbi:MAG: hypothetical protein LC126_07505 [Bryobacterales bacterium]|nr:hypothetical protein [Bryobacterales bacterium]
MPSRKDYKAGRVKIEGEPARTREVKRGCVLTSSSADEEGDPIRDPHSTTYTGVIGTAEDFARRIYREAFQRSWSRAKIKVILGDDAIWIRNLAADQFSGAILIVDFYHAAEHLHKISRLLFPGDEAARLRWVSFILITAVA